MSSVQTNRINTFLLLVIDLRVLLTSPSPQKYEFQKSNFRRVSPSCHDWLIYYLSRQSQRLHVWTVGNEHATTSDVSDTPKELIMWAAPSVRVLALSVRHVVSFQIVPGEPRPSGNLVRGWGKEFYRVVHE